MTLKEIKIGWKTFKIEKTNIDNRLIYNPITCYGEIIFDDDVIRLNERNSKEQDDATLIHECLHGISDMYTLDMSEDLITKLGNAISTVLSQNNLEIKCK